MPEGDLDAIDARILAELQRNARLSNVELASKIGLSPSPCLARVRALHQAGIIKRHVALLDADLIGWHLTAFVQVSLREPSREVLDGFRDMVRDCPQVMECYLVAGETDYLLRIVGKDVDELREFIVTTLISMDCVATCRSAIVLQEIKYETAFQINVI